jgi:hypothetical protein
MAVPGNLATGTRPPMPTDPDRGHTRDGTRRPTPPDPATLQGVDQYQNVSGVV